MPKFTIEAAYLMPVYRHRTYEAETLEAACALALADDDWEGQKDDPESSRETYLDAAWQGEEPFDGPALAIPRQFREGSDEGREALARALRHVFGMAESALNDKPSDEDKRAENERAEEALGIAKVELIRLLGIDVDAPPAPVQAAPRAAESFSASARTADNPLGRHG